ncbi:MAG: hypothetical protein U0V70_16140 [Terriglobia bacterium]
MFPKVVTRCEGYQGNGAVNHIADTAAVSLRHPWVGYMDSVRIDKETVAISKQFGPHATLYDSAKMLEELPIDVGIDLMQG